MKNINIDWNTRVCSHECLKEITDFIESTCKPRFPTLLVPDKNKKAFCKV